MRTACLLMTAEIRRCGVLTSCHSPAPLARLVDQVSISALPSSVIPLVNDMLGTALVLSLVRQRFSCALFLSLSLSHSLSHSLSPSLTLFSPGWALPTPPADTSPLQPRPAHLGSADVPFIAASLMHDIISSFSGLSVGDALRTSVSMLAHAPHDSPLAKLCHRE